MSVQRQTVHSARFTTSGRDQSWSPPMSSMQAEMAEAPFETDRVTVLSALRRATLGDIAVALIVAVIVIASVAVL